jgi:hypothetical protein
MTPGCCRSLIVAAGLLAAAVAAAAPSDDRPRVFLDCADGCFQDYVRTEITFVDYVRDRAAADVHVLVSTQETGAGGHEYALRLIGAGRFATMNETVRYASEKEEPEERTRRGVAQVMKLGLMRYVAQTGMGSRISISSSEPTAAARPVKDRWKSWVFSVRGSGDIEGEESSTKYSAEIGASADRITPDWKISFGGSASHEEDKYDVDGRDVVSTKVFRIGEGLAIKSLGPHWSAGGHAAVWKNTFENTRSAAGFGPMLEYSLFPYDQHTRRQLRVSYRLELRDIQYEEETLFEKAGETLSREEVEINLQRRETWGSLEGELELSHYLHDLGKYRVNVRLEAALRLFQGLSLNLGAEGSRVRDQLSLPRRGATAEEILLEQRQLASGFQYEANVGLTYTFGSIYNNVVNPRFGD